MDVIDTKIGGVADYVASRTSTLQSEEKSDIHYVKQNIVVGVSDDDSYGKILFTKVLDVTLDATTASMSGGWEQYEIQHLELDSKCASPLGTSSGSTQIAHITDPYNIGFETTLPSSNNVLKLIRQAGSVVIRPRDPVVLKPLIKGRKYTIKGPDARLSQFGAIVAGVRETPDAGDHYNIDITITAAVVFFRMASYVNNSAFFTTTMLLHTFEFANKEYTMSGASLQGMTNLECEAVEPLHLLHTEKVNGHDKIQLLKARKFNIEQIAPNKYKLILNSKYDKADLKCLSQQVLVKVQAPCEINSFA